uniref:RING-type domain-containing protein n=1 Tax=Poecilia mexicana TaxID=48701 RepID=A0A3B3YSD1_9TELE
SSPTCNFTSEMSSGSSLWSKDQFLCSICQDVFTDPVSTPCGHNFCKTCITRLWDANVPYKCPLCNEHFASRPQLRVNTLLKEMVDQFRGEAQQEVSSSSEQQAAKPGEVPCDVCTGPKLKALKSCMVCLASYCQTHLEPHLTAPHTEMVKMNPEQTGSVCRHLQVELSSGLDQHPDHRFVSCCGGEHQGRHSLQYL